ncbi:PEP-CTERM sorting domain-containing protein [Lacipirellula sp.]|uniref:PEP-CTERM sorting domain-containing protein n=1 Tax=Lacipirellula sp. TaxID=2691419 RepID=UPI003D098A60
MTKNLCLLAGMITLLWTSALSSPASAVTLESTFDAGLEGWTGSTGGDLAFVSTGGNPGGFLQQTDTDLSDMFVTAPASFLGDKSAFLNGTLSFDARQVGGNAEKYAAFGFVTLFNGGNAISADIAGANAPSNDWTTFSVNLNAVGFETTPEAVAAVLSNVTMIMVTLESQIGVAETTGMDNFRMVSVPEPATLGIAGLGLCGVGLLRRKRG